MSAISPFFLLFGGFQGSGKTSVINILRKRFLFNVISSDRIRYVLLKNKFPFDKNFEIFVETLTFNLVLRSLSIGQHTIIDANYTPSRIQKLHSYLRNHQIKHKQFSIFLKAQEKTLIERIKTRKKINGYYQGTIAELKLSIKKHGHINDSYYNVVIDTNNNNLTQICDMITNSYVLILRYV